MQEGLILENISTISKKTMWKKYLMVFVLTFTNIVYLIPYLSIDFYTQFLQAYGLTDGQLGNLITYFGFTAVPGYLLGGWLADILNPKKMVVSSCLCTSAVAIAVAFSKSYTVLLVLHLLYGITSTLLNWGAYLKVIRMLGDDDEQGRLYGSADIAYGLFSLCIEYGVLALTTTYLADHPMGFKIAILIYAGISVITGIAVYFIVPQKDLKDYKNLDNTKDSIKLDLLGKTLKMPLTWYLSFFTLGYFIIRSTIPYINPYLSDAYGVSVTSATAFTATIRTITITTMSPFGGWVRDKMNGKSTPLVIISSIFCIALSIVLALIPQAASLKILVMSVGIIILLFSASLTTCLYTPVSEGKISVTYTGTVLGVASAIGYSSDIWLYNLCGTWIDNMGNGGYTYIWYLTAAGGVIMLITGILLWIFYKKINGETAELPKEIN